MRVDLPSGGWVQFREPEKVSYGARKKVERVYFSESTDQADVNEQVAAALISAWSFEMPIPSQDLGSLDGLDAHDMDTIISSFDGCVQRMFLNTEPSPDETSPTVPSAVSSTSSAEGAPTPITRLPTSGVNTG